MPSPDVAPPNLPSDPLLPRVVAICERHTRLLALQLTAAVDELGERCPEARDEPVFARAWERFSSLRGRPLRELLEEPAVEAWIGHLQVLVRSPALRACPNLHVPRAFARFSVFLLGLAEVERSGRATVSGSGSIPILRGTAHLRPRSARRTAVQWSWNGGLCLQHGDGRPLIEIAPDGSVVAAGVGDWTLDVSRPAIDLRVFGEPRCVQHPGAGSAPTFRARFARLCEALPPWTRRLLQASARAVGPRCDQHPLEARSWLGLGPSPTVEEVASGLARNLVSCCSDTYRFDASSSLTVALGEETQGDLVRSVAQELLNREPARPDSRLAEMLAVCASGEPVRPAAEAEHDTEPILDFRPVLTAAGIRTAELDLWTQPKSQRRTRAPRWRTLDALLDLTPDETARFRAALDGWPQPEVRHFGLACVDYFEGRFAAGAAHVLACIEADRACEEYWLLLALTARVRRQFQLFDDIVFAGLRTEALLRQARESL